MNVPISPASELAPLLIKDIQQHFPGLILSARLGAHSLHPNHLLTDSRLFSEACRQPRWFLALTGESFDGEDYVEKALELGAAGIVSRRDRLDLLPQDIGFIRVKDTREFYAALASAWRKQLAAKVVAITGSSGKTTLKSMLACLCSFEGKTHATLSNENNELGVPKTLLSTPQDAGFLIVEIGARKPHDIQPLCKLVRPHVAICTHIGTAHLEIFGSQQALTETKKEIFTPHPDLEAIIINADDPKLKHIEPTEARIKRISFGESPSADVHVKKHEPSLDDQGVQLLFSTPTNPSLTIKQAQIAPKLAINSAAAIACATALRLKENLIVQGFAKYMPPQQRFELKTLHSGAVIIDDAYNANPESLVASLQAAQSLIEQLASKRPTLPKTRTAFVLADMLELGSEASRLHERAAKAVSSILTEGDLYYVGIHAKSFIRGLSERKPPSIKSYASVEDLIQDFQAVYDIIYVKGSRGMGLDIFIKRYTKPRP